MKSETQVLREICDYLASCKYFFWRVNNIPVFGRALPKYTPKGLPDIFMLYHGRFIGIEVKREGSETEREVNGRRVRAGMLTPEQAMFGSRVAMNGGEYRCVRSVEDVKHFISGIST